MNNIVIKTFLGLLFFYLVIFYGQNAYAAEPGWGWKAGATAAEEKYAHDKKTLELPFAISFYEPSYILPVTYSTAYSPLYIQNNPEKGYLHRLELDFKLSFKLPIINNIAHKDNALFLAYTQNSAWQVYRDNAFFRNSDYRPEIFISFNTDTRLIGNWRFQLVNMGFMHESNGYGVPLERSWNRIYLEGVFSQENWVISIKPWYIIPESSMSLYNNNIARYLGRGRLVVAYNYQNQAFSGEVYNVENGLDLTSVKLTWSFPLIKKIKGYVQVFHGYGHNLLDYNCRKNSIGIGLAFNDWI